MSVMRPVWCWAVKLSKYRCLSVVTCEDFARNVHSRPDKFSCLGTFFAQFVLGLGRYLRWTIE